MKIVVILDIKVYKNFLALTNFYGTIILLRGEYGRLF